MNRIVCSPSVVLSPLSSAGRYQGLPKPRIEGSGRHQIENQVSTRPATDRRTFSVRSAEAGFAQTILKQRELGVGSDRHDCVDVKCRPNRSSGGIGQQQSSDAAADERDLLEQRRQFLCHVREAYKIWIGQRSSHLESILAVNSRIAISRSRARPSRIASTRATSS